MGGGADPSGEAALERTGAGAAAGGPGAAAGLEQGREEECPGAPAIVLRCVLMAGEGIGRVS